MSAAMALLKKSFVEKYPHSLTQEEAQLRVQALTEYWDGRYGTRTEWHGNAGEISGKVLGVRFRGIFQVHPDILWGEIKSGYLGAKLGGRSYLLRKLGHYLDPCRSLEDLRELAN